MGSTVGSTEGSAVGSAVGSGVGWGMTHVSTWPSLFVSVGIVSGGESSIEVEEGDKREIRLCLAAACRPPAASSFRAGNRNGKTNLDCGKMLGDAALAGTEPVSRHALRTAIPPVLPEIRERQRISGHRIASRERLPLTPCHGSA